jgi:hypothetical protein
MLRLDNPGNYSTPLARPTGSTSCAARPA